MHVMLKWFSKESHLGPFNVLLEKSHEKVTVNNLVSAGQCQELSCSESSALEKVLVMIC